MSENSNWQLGLAEYIRQRDRYRFIKDSGIAWGENIPFFAGRVAGSHWKLSFEFF
ncbi:MAG: hypothetical protein HDR20_08540 [Lachnospiraceae bacterium]|nr:hypothetical protein [Lachnospiraceae bacterium]